MFRHTGMPMGVLVLTLLAVLGVISTTLGVSTAYEADSRSDVILVGEDPTESVDEPVAGEKSDGRIDELETAVVEDVMMPIALAWASAVGLVVYELFLWVPLAVWKVMLHVVGSVILIVGIGSYLVLEYRRMRYLMDG